MRNFFGKNNPRWNGGRRFRHGKYVSVKKPEHPNADVTGYILEDHLIMEKVLGRFIKKGEVVHHINGDTLDNRTENLRLMTCSSHKKAHPDIGKSTRYKKGRIATNKTGSFKSCSVCGNSFWVIKSAISRKFCSTCCYGVSKKGISPVWLNG